MPKKTQAKKEVGEIVIRCTGSAMVDVAELVPFQGNFKGMTKADLDRFKFQLTEQGIAAASTVWKREVKGKTVLSLLDGHQRREALMALRKEGWVVPPLPINFTECKNEAHARRIVMSLASTYGHVNQEGLVDFMSLAGLEIPKLEQQFSFPDFDLASFTANLPEDGSRKVEFKVKPAKKITCPNCGHLFKVKDQKKEAM